MSIQQREIKSVCVFCGSSSGSQKDYISEAKELGSLLAQRGVSLVYGGGDAGLMGAVSRAHYEAGGKPIGIIPQALEDKVAHRKEVELHVVPHMHERKSMMYEISDAFIALPGGIGTLEELFESFTWNQLGYLDKPLGLLNTAGYFDGLVSFMDNMVEEGFLKSVHRDRLAVDTSPCDLVDKLYTAPVGYTGKWG